MIPEITSFTFRYALSIPGILAHKAPATPPANVAKSQRIESGIKVRLKATNIETKAPIIYCPGVPILNKPHLNAKATESPVIMIGTDRYNTSPILFIPR